MIKFALGLVGGAVLAVCVIYVWMVRTWPRS
jgi:hypothetical protein